MAKYVLVHAGLFVGESGSQGDPPDSTHLRSVDNETFRGEDCLHKLPNSSQSPRPKKFPAIGYLLTLVFRQRCLMARGDPA
jgi:hypothetical protein